MLKNILTGNVIIGYVFNKISISNDREKNIMEMRFGFISGKEKTQKEVADELGIEMDEGSLHYERFLTHVKFLLQRIYRKELLEEEENEITEMMQRKYCDQVSLRLRSHAAEPRKLTAPMAK